MTSPSRASAVLSLALVLAAASPWLPGAARASNDPATVAAGGITLRSATLSLPSSDRLYPAGPHADVINNNCLTCHSAGMVLTQPLLTRAEWEGEVTKMVKVYKAPVAPEDAALIVDYLAQLKPPR